MEVGLLAEQLKLNIPEDLTIANLELLLLEMTNI